MLHVGGKNGLCSNIRSCTLATIGSSDTVPLLQIVLRKQRLRSAVSCVFLASGRSRRSKPSSRIYGYRLCGSHTYTFDVRFKLSSEGSIACDGNPLTTFRRRRGRGFQYSQEMLFRSAFLIFYSHVAQWRYVVFISLRRGTCMGDGRLPSKPMNGPKARFQAIDVCVFVT